MSATQADFLSAFFYISLFYFIGTPPTVVLPPGGGYWADGVDDNPSDEDNEPRPQPGTPQQVSRRPNIDTDDTAKYYRRFFVGKVRFIIEEALSMRESLLVLGSFMI